MTTTDDHGAIHDLLERLFDAWNRRDARAFAALFTEDGDYVTGAGEWWRGRRMIEGEVAARFDAAADAPGVARLADRSIRHLVTDAAIAHLAWSLVTGREPAPERRGVASAVLVRDARGSWLIASLHNTDVVAEEGQEP